MEYRYSLTGVVHRIEEEIIFSQYFKKRDVILRYSDVNNAGNIVEKNVKFQFQNNEIAMAEGLRVDDMVQVEFYIDGKDIVKDDRTLNFTTLVVYDMTVLSSPTRDTAEDKSAVITEMGRDYEKKNVEASDEELAGVKKDPLVEEWEKSQKKEKDVFDDLPF